MSTVFTEATPAEMVSEARAILAEVVDAPWPAGDRAEQAIGYQVDSAREALREYGLLLSGDMDPYGIRAPDMGWWDDPEASALEYAADQARECARAARNMLAQKIRDEEKHQGAGNGTGGMRS